MKPTISYKLTLLMVLALSLSLSGCANFFSQGSDAPAEKQAVNASATSPEPREKKPTAIYYDFEDIIIPLELAMVKDRTVIVATPGFKSGILTLRGRVDSTSLFNFFSNNMEKDNWQVVSKIKSPGTTIMVFQKTARSAVITIRDEQIYTYVEIGVAPTLSGPGQTGNLTY